MYGTASMSPVYAWFEGPVGQPRKARARAARTNKQRACWWWESSPTNVHATQRIHLIWIAQRVFGYFRLMSFFHEIL